MRALTVRQPWATLIALGVKRYETRSRPTKVRGRIAIHAGAAAPCRADAPLVLGRYAVWRWDRGNYFLSSATAPDRAGRPDLVDSFPVSLPLGVVVATADLVDCIRTEDWSGSFTEWQLGNYEPGRFAWLLADVRPLAEPVPARGALGWWDWTPPEGVA